MSGSQNGGMRNSKYGKCSAFASAHSAFLSRSVLGIALLATLALPFLLRPDKDARSVAQNGEDLPSEKLILISPHWEGVRREFGRAFSEWTVQRLGHRTELEWLDIGGTSDGIRYVKSEFTRSPQGINVDLFFGGGVDPFMQLSDAGLLEIVGIPPYVLDAIPPTFSGIKIYDAEAGWFGTALAGFGILHNKKICERLNLSIPVTWQDLGRPEFLTWVGSGDPRSSGSIHMAYEIMLQAYGWEKGWEIVTRMCGNTRNFSRSGSQVPKDAAIGEVACGMSIDVYAWKQVAEVGADRMGFILPEGLTVINPDGIAILKGAPHPELAARFIEFVLTDPGQKLWCLKQGVPGGPRDFELDRMPVIPGFAARFGEDAAVAYDAYQWKSGFTYDPNKGSQRWTILNDLIGATMIDTHRELVAAWRRVSALPSDHEQVKALTAPPMAEAALLQLAKTNWNDAEFRARTRAAWANEAKARYRRIKVRQGDGRD